MKFEYIEVEVFYNRNSRHAKLKNQAPAEFAKSYRQNLKEKLHNNRTCPATKSGLTQLPEMLINISAKAKGNYNA